MTTPGNLASEWRRTACAVLAFLLLGSTPVIAADSSPEREHLAALSRQLDLLDRLAEYSASLPRQEGSRYHFDYARLREDIERVRAGIRDYLTPQRAQPRDPVVLVGGYRQESEEEDTP
ncbi:RAQPRD family integrative conjugative element protein [Methyloversatilis discipulorum]|uniref:integrative conjugative element protein, RAQPRD family n=1 Tax=Methyloversatilis discipulorum TaxID=1119528 RepID=UPI003F6731AE